MTKRPTSITMGAEYRSSVVYYKDEADAYMDALEARLTASEARVVELEETANAITESSLQTIADLREKLATARRDALEEAAKEIGSTCHRHGDPRVCSVRCLQERIRARIGLAALEPVAKETKGAEG